MSNVTKFIKDATIPESSILLPIVMVDGYANLDYKNKNAINKLANRKHAEEAIQILNDKNIDDKIKNELIENINNKELDKIYDDLSDKSKKVYNNVPIRDKYALLKDKQQKIEKKKKSKEAEMEKHKQQEKTNTKAKSTVAKETVTIQPELGMSVSVGDDVKSKTTKPKSRLVDIDAEVGVDSAHEAVDAEDIDANSNANASANKIVKDTILEDTDIKNVNVQDLFDDEQIDEDDGAADLVTHAKDKDSRKDYKKDSSKDSSKDTNDVNIKRMVKTFWDASPYTFKRNENLELEVRFGTRKVKPITITDYDNVIRKLKSLGFAAIDVNGLYSLRVNCEYLDSYTGKTKLSNIRTEINGLDNIQQYCKTNDIKQLYHDSPTSINFVKKRGTEKPVNVDDFNFRVAYSNEEIVAPGLKTFIISNWKKSKKTFRFMNRVTFSHDNYPFNIDLSITKYSTKQIDKWGKHSMKRVYSVGDSNVFTNPPEYEIEIEVNNKVIGPGTLVNDASVLLSSLKKVIKYVLCGLQTSSYPVSYVEMKTVMDDYMKLIWGDEYNTKKRVTNKNFIGPSSRTLQLENICNDDANSLEPNIRKSFVVTDKADGTRNLLFITENGRIFLIDMNMNVIFTGAKTKNKEVFNSILDGELIRTNKNGDYINLYAAFDIYYYNKKDVRANSFVLPEDEKDIHKSRYQTMKSVIKNLDAISVIDNGDKKILAPPIRISHKEFYPYSAKESIFDGCNQILTKIEENRFEYETDGLIISHAYFGVGSDKINSAGSKYKKLWDYSFKWKPSNMNTIDFLVTTIKAANGDDVVKPIFEDGTNNESSSQLSEYKTIELRCGFNEYRDGYINPCQNMIDDKLPEYTSDESYKYDIYPMRFYPSTPYDVDAGITKIMLNNNDVGKKEMMTEEFEVFTDDTIVEFSYDFDRKEGWRWVPLRVRHDKTTEYRQGNKQFGNAYATCNNNWKSIHYPVTEDMIRTGKNIPDMLLNEDIYYNTPSGNISTKALKHFHNTYVKKMLIKNVSKPGNILIDYACGKAGDLNKWIDSKLSFVFGIDISKDNLENRIDGACARYLNSKKEHKNIPDALFVNGNTAYNIKNGGAMLNDKAVQITKAVFGEGSNDSKTLGKGVSKNYGKGQKGFDVASCQFAIHYFFESPTTLQGFMRNVAETTKLNGHFIGTTYDGVEVFNLLKRTGKGDSVKLLDNGRKIWEIIKNYGSEVFPDDSSSIGYKISVFQESINQHIVEYLVNFNYLCRVFESYGFVIITNEEAEGMGLPSGSGLFSKLYDRMLEEISRNKYKQNEFGKSTLMTSSDKKISFLNRYFVFKKVREVNTEKVQLEMSEYNEFDIEQNKKDTKTAVKVAKKVEKTSKPKKAKRLTKKLLLVPTEEEGEKEYETKKDEPQEDVEEKEHEKVTTTKKKATTATKKSATKKKTDATNVTNATNKKTKKSSKENTAKSKSTKKLKIIDE